MRARKDLKPLLEMPPKESSNCILVFSIFCGSILGSKNKYLPRKQITQNLTSVEPFFSPPENVFQALRELSETCLGENWQQTASKCSKYG